MPWRNQQGAALLLVALVVIALTLSWLVSQISPRMLQAKRDAVTQQSLKQAKQALLAYALTQQSASSSSSTWGRPGSLPCPDLEAPGQPGYGFSSDDAGTKCNTQARRIGRLPFFPLQIDELKDSSGEPLWYAIVSGIGDGETSLPINNSFDPATASGNWYQVYSNAGRSRLSSADDPVVAIIFAPGSIIGTQRRDTPADQVIASNYLEKAVSPHATATFTNYQVNSGAFLDGPVSDASGNTILNDRVQVIRRSELMRPLEARAATEYQQLLALWRLYVGSGKWPNPADPGDTACTGSNAPSTGCASQTGRCQGKLPDAKQIGTAIRTKASPPYLSLLDRQLNDYEWLYRNRWGQGFFYAISSAALSTATAASCHPSLTLVNLTPTLAPTQAIDAVMIGSGPPLTSLGQQRSATAQTQLSNFLDPVTTYNPTDLNQQGWNTSASATPLAPDIYAKPSTNGNDRLYYFIRGNDANAPWLHAR